MPSRRRSTSCCVRRCVRPAAVPVVSLVRLRVFTAKHRMSARRSSQVEHLASKVHAHNRTQLLSQSCKISGRLCTHRPFIHSADARLRAFSAATQSAVLPRRRHPPPRSALTVVCVIGALCCIAACALLCSHPCTAACGSAQQAPTAFGLWHACSNCFAEAPPSERAGREVNPMAHTLCRAPLTAVLAVD